MNYQNCVKVVNPYGWVYSLGIRPSHGEDQKFGTETSVAV